MKFTAEQQEYLERVIEMAGLRITRVDDNIFGSVKGDILSDVFGDVDGDVKGKVWGTVDGEELT